ncbi:alpha/beta hydrolase [Virgisporangium aurantiacum]|uniref:alpha/beta hydrolase n=1 Tax=Virgisporangium aurantiacum TaxID=175570 RepID=UPI001EF165E8|nr:alpha/beta hydrolase [Virgisporangium aurantiacum]
MSEFQIDRVTFRSGDVDLVGVLRLVDGPAPAVVLTGPFTGVKDQVVGLYAERLAAAGISTLAFDHRGFGESGGRRGHEDSGGKLADLRAAVDLLAERISGERAPADRLGVVGICLGGGYAVRAAAQDPRLRAAVGIAGAYNSPAWFARQMGVDTYRSALRSFLDRYDEFVPAVAPNGGEAAMAGDEPYAYYGTARSASPHWTNAVTRGSLHSLMTFDALGAAPLLAGTPLLIVHGKVDAYCSPDLAAAMHAETAGDKGIVWLDANEHIDLYDREPWVTEAVDATAGFLHKRLITP